LTKHKKRCIIEIQEEKTYSKNVNKWVKCYQGGERKMEKMLELLLNGMKLDGLLIKIHKKETVNINDQLKQSQEFLDMLIKEKRIKLLEEKDEKLEMLIKMSEFASEKVQEDIKKLKIKKEFDLKLNSVVEYLMGNEDLGLVKIVNKHIVDLIEYIEEKMEV